MHESIILPGGVGGGSVVAYAGYYANIYLAMLICYIVYILVLSLYYLFSYKLEYGYRLRLG